MKLSNITSVATRVGIIALSVMNPLLPHYLPEGYIRRAIHYLEATGPALFGFFNEMSKRPPEHQDQWTINQFIQSLSLSCLVIAAFLKAPWNRDTQSISLDRSNQQISTALEVTGLVLHVAGEIFFAKTSHTQALQSTNPSAIDKG